ncbi:hypothetical protein TPHA_0I01060 [Tetrapisispora phaffii CBS 4417]|uniref:K Homology domain-containing protein n=1 Tax=Tetrapisispora phaffii (strain ATCC 24235 / CBS 4417 / NBRC 1672 / NRRL Y-8282 / UCD 70-5) TaxID=1071381 RepID=G8BXI4_TETPH|nr:hypothetical protein TPHA_0I01060 [Tetrapisispora phaffii CBS 4417]CCE64612.1 hypothetical protein TPHA_0I01060 [Tetrapisispora phaffii CBS 4417]
MSDLTQEMSNTVVVDSELINNTEENENPVAIVQQGIDRASLPSLKDLPQLGSSHAFANTKVNWGPNVKPNVVANAVSSNSSSPSPISASKPMRSNYVQEALTLDLQSQLSITKPEFARIVQSIKQTHKVSLESTLSKNSRTFLISGKREDVQEAKRDLVKKMTRPISTIFEIPSNCRSAIIGKGGQTIREISSKYDVKIDVAKEVNDNSYNEELNDYSANISLHGDVASVNLAKLRIMDIVKEETKNSTAKFTIDNEKILSLVDLSQFTNQNSDTIKVQFFERSGDVIISGLREEVKATKQNIENYFKQLENDSTEEKIKIPAKFQILIDAQEIKQLFNVIVTFPENVEDETVVFIGQRNKVAEAIAHARSSSKSYSCDTLDISKSHSKNIDHAKFLAFYFNKYGALDFIKKEYPNVNITLPSTQTLKSSNDVTIIISAKQEYVSDIKVVRREIVNLVNTITPLDTLIVDDLDFELFHKEVRQILTGLEEETKFIQVGDYFSGDDRVILFCLTSADDFKPSAEEILESLKKANDALNPLRQKQNSLETAEFDLDDETQEKLLSKNSFTRNILLNEVSSNDSNIQMKLHTPSANKLFIRGNEKAIKIARKAVKLIIDSPSLKTKISFEVPANTVSRLVGNKGSNLQSIREKFDCSIDVPNNVDSNSKEGVEVVLTGLEYNLNHAKIYVLNEAKKWADIISKELIVPAKFHRSMIGSQGVYKNRLQDKYNVRIIFPHSGDVVTIRGPSRGVSKAYEELKALLDFEVENGYKSIVKVPTEHVARVIGKSGETINDIRADFGVELDFLQNASDENAVKAGFVELEITGSRSGIREAESRVNSIVNEASDFTNESLVVERQYHRFIVGSGGQNLRDIISKAGGDEIRNKSIQIPNADSNEEMIVVSGPKKFVDAAIKEIKKIVDDFKKRVTKELEIPNDRQGALIGPGGIVRNQLESEFNITLDVPQKGQTGKVKISGLEENIEKAIKKITTEILRDNYDVEIQVPANVHEYVADRGSLIQQLRYDNFINVRHGNDNRRATKLSNTEIVIPIEKVAGAETDKVKVTVEEVSSPTANEEGTISWRLTYEPLDDIIMFDGEEQEQTKPKETPEQKAEKKKEVIAKVTKIIEDRISAAPSANYAGYVWSANPRNFNKVVGPGGSNVKKIRNSTNTIISVPKRSDKVNNVIYVRGTKEDVTKATEIIVKTLN